jgi:1,4-dihydroxy-2-naphthoyl-CoA hydrolase
MSIWFKKDLKIQDFLHLGKNTMSEFLEMEFVEIGNDFLKMQMPVTNKTKRPFGILHGGASVALAETVGSFASALVVDSSLKNCVGLEINANHIKSVSDGFVIATCKPIHLGRSTHVWDIQIHSHEQKLICISRLTVAILDR